MFQNLAEIVGVVETQWPTFHILVIGDVILDQYIWGRAERISREAPVPVVLATHHENRPGGAANVAMNITGMGARATVIGFVGDDKDAESLASALDAAQVAHQLRSVAGFPTTRKLRILAGSQQVVRLDHENPKDRPEVEYNHLLDAVRAMLPNVDAVVLSDYAKGVVTEGCATSVIREARAAGKPVFVDPKCKDWSRFRGATTICPNTYELALTVGEDSDDVDAMLRAAGELARDLELDFLTVTLGSRGIAIVTAEDCIVYPAVAKQVFDVSGAGDTVIAMLALCLPSGFDVATSIKFANVAAGVVIGKVGTAPTQKQEILTALQDPSAS